MNSNKIGAFLKQIPLFADMTKEQCQIIGASGQSQIYDPGQTLSMDNGTDGLYIVLTGALSTSQNIENGQDQKDAIRFTTGYCFQIPNPSRVSRNDCITVLRKSELLSLTRATLDQIIMSVVGALPFFHNLGGTQLQAISHEMFLESYNKGEILFRQGDLASALYVVADGEVAIIRHYQDSEGEGQDIQGEIATARRGSILGERGVLVDQPRAGSARFKERTLMLVLQAEKFKALATEYPEIELELYRYLTSLLEEQSLTSWRAVQDRDRMKELIQATKMAALGQLVAGIAHEINTPVGAISSNSNQLRDILAETRKHYEELPLLLTKSYDPGVLQKIAQEMRYELDGSAEELVKRSIARQIDSIQQYYKKVGVDALFDDMRDISNELSEAASRIRDMVKSLANFARLGEAELKTVDVHEGLESTLSVLRHELKYKVVVEKNYDNNLPEITCYPNQLNQVFINILMNAIQALDLPKLKEGEKGLIRIDTYPKDEWAVIAIHDSGKGIPAKNLDRIFEPFFSTKGAAAAAGGLGLGLGLSISQKIIQEKHLGKIQVESEVGKGTTFFIKLPIHRPAPITPTKINSTHERG
jgi:signal transduction histidine kinase